ncbi:Pleckstrin homology domain-containing protein [Aspergillus pseudoustus]|uniref:Pleckstrin homology domain-containing protein n=1 Tax=Aspergillus pseudoustus TaxID=1810923 RepID=A0ABR4KSN0_9EURO
MSTQHAGEARMDATNSNTPHDGCPGLEPGSYTAEKLRHASPSHVHITSKRFFIGPIPKNWLQSHRKSWYKKRLNFRNYRSRAITFSAESDFAREIEPPRTVDLPDVSEETEQDIEQDTEQEQDLSDQETLRPTQHLRTLSHPYQEDQEPPTPTPDEDDFSTPNEDNYGGTPTTAKRDTRSDYFTARERAPTTSNTDTVPSSSRDRQPMSRESPVQQNEQALRAPGQHNARQSFPSAPPSESGSTVPLLAPSRSNDKGKQRSMRTPALQQQEPQRAVSRGGDEEPQHREPSQRNPKSISRRITTRFSLNDNLHNKQQRIASKFTRTQNKVPEWLSRRKIEEGGVIKAERMLVRVEETIQDDLPEDYSEYDSLRMETRVQDSWREFLVVCRSTADKDAPFTLQMYKTRVIPKIQEPTRKVTPYHEIAVGRRAVRTNLYSTLDKTIAIWHRSKRGTSIYILRPKSTTRAVEWYTFLSHISGRHRASSLAINVPDLAVSLVFNNPFRQLEAAESQQNDGTSAIPNTVTADQSACLSIIQGCMKMLGNHPEWSEVLKQWSNSEKMGLAWKRYDRLEWVYGSNEEEMYGSLAMEGTHELELRPKQHYDTSVGIGADKQEEPMPIEGFLIRLTSQKGVHQRMNRMFSKRLYFFSQDHYLFFCQPSQALPPAPPQLCEQESDIPSTQEILDATPLSYEVDPFPVQNGGISWLSNGNPDHLKQHDENAYAQLQRNVHNLSNAEGFINLCRVQDVRYIREDSPPNVRGGWDAGANTSGTNPAERSNPTEQSDEDAGFEMLLSNDLVVRFQAYNRTTRDEWMKRLGALAKYWRARTAADALELKNTRQRNLDLLGIDEELESLIGQFSKKWEVRKTEASPLLHNMCSLLGCRPIKMSGLLYKKPRRHATFKRFHVMLTAGKLLIYHSSLRKRSGNEVPHIHYNVESTIDLDNCYIYSGLLTDSDLLYANQTFDSNHPGHGALPRVYLTSDVYTSSDEDTAITFVIWQPLRKNLFRARELGEKGQTRQTLKQVSKLGTHGRTIVFKARSRVEKDRWVLSIASEIDRLQEGKPEDIRLTTA